MIVYSLYQIEPQYTSYFSNIYIYLSIYLSQYITFKHAIFIAWFFQPFFPGPCRTCHSFSAHAPADVVPSGIRTAQRMWLKQCHLHDPRLGMVTIPPINMVMIGGWFIGLPTAKFSENI